MCSLGNAFTFRNFQRRLSLAVKKRVRIMSHVPNLIEWGGKKGRRERKKGINESVRKKRFGNGSDGELQKPAFLPADSAPPAVVTALGWQEAQTRRGSRQNLALQCAPPGRPRAGRRVGGRDLSEHPDTPRWGSPPRLDVIEALACGGADGRRFPL